jgi:hypothetical protein
MCASAPSIPDDKILFISSFDEAGAPTGLIAKRPLIAAAWIYGADAPA